MTLKQALLTATILLALPATAAQAATEHDGVSIGATVSSLGLGGEVGWRFADRFGVRAVGNGISFNGNGRSDNIRYDYDIKLRSYGALADYYPWMGGLRVTAGARYDDNHVTVDSGGNSSVTVAGVNVPVPTGSVDARGRYNRFAPYLGAGYDGNLGGGFVIGMDVGALFQGGAKVRVRDSSGLVPANTLDDVRDDVKDAMDNVRVYPVVGLTIGYRF